MVSSLLILLMLMSLTSGLPMSESQEEMSSESSYERPLERAIIQTEHLVPLNFPSETSRLPRRKNLRVSRLLRKMGDDFLVDWMSVDDPDKSGKEAAILAIDKEQRDELDKQIDDLRLDELINGLMNNKKDKDKNNDKDNDNDISKKVLQWSSSSSSWLVSETVSSLESLLLERASCPVSLEWLDLGILFWPRYIRQGVCRGSSCSWPQGLRCEPKASKTLHLLRWHCGSSGRSRRKRCRWYKVPYPVTQSCSCGGKSNVGCKQ